MKVFRCMRLLRLVVWFLRATESKRGGRKVSANLGRLVKGSGVRILDTHTVLKAGGFTTHAHRRVGEGQWRRQVLWMFASAESDMNLQL